MFQFIGRQSTLFNNSELQGVQERFHLDPAYHNNCGLFHSRQEDYLKAIECYNRSIELNPRLSQVYFNRAIAKQKLNLLQSALDDLNEAIKLNFDSESVQTLKDQILQQIQNNQNLLNNQFQQLNIGSNISQQELMQVIPLLNNGDLKQALKISFDVLKTNKENYQQFIQRGLLFENLVNCGRKENSRKLIIFQMKQMQVITFQVIYYQFNFAFSTIYKLQIKLLISQRISINILTMFILFFGASQWRAKLIINLKPKII